ncbi:MAG: hypothetical protein QOF94_483 [Acidobacteriaceae bacterium]|jgi:hypothetical protein
MQKKLPNGLPASLLICALAIAVANPPSAEAKSPEGASMPKVGEMAPEFKLSYFDGADLKDVSLSQYKGKKNVVLAFFIFAFTGG